MQAVQNTIPDFNYLRSYNPPLKRQTDLNRAETQEPSKEDIETAKLKRTLSECKYAALAVIILYFGIKRICVKKDAVNAGIGKVSIACSKIGK